MPHALLERMGNPGGRGALERGEGEKRAFKRGRKKEYQRLGKRFGTHFLTGANQLQGVW